jgi:hypothetical protein
MSAPQRMTFAVAALTHIVVLPVSIVTVIPAVPAVEIKEKAMSLIFRPLTLAYKYRLGTILVALAGFVLSAANANAVSLECLYGGNAPNDGFWLDVDYANGRLTWGASATASGTPQALPRRPDSSAIKRSIGINIITTEKSPGFSDWIAMAASCS